MSRHSEFEDNREGAKQTYPSRSDRTVLLASLIKLPVYWCLLLDHCACSQKKGREDIWNAKLTVTGSRHLVQVCVLAQSRCRPRRTKGASATEHPHFMRDAEENLSLS